ncbi:hypothetical protein [Nocardia neocaledoniensis]|uniref:hypothetical protein n=1 Tax=Nocardia neocaledoniensis TaxID=236511 RepID=UPI00245615D8|nr:hypothetical protein [Nocardia neocaledoniensis]
MPDQQPDTHPTTDTQLCTRETPCPDCETHQPADLLAEGRELLAAARLQPLIALDLRTVVTAQLGAGAAGHANAALIVWTLNNLPRLLEENEHLRSSARTWYRIACNTGTMLAAVHPRPEPAGYLTAFRRDPDGPIEVDFGGQLFTRDEAAADLADLTGDPERHWVAIEAREVEL